MTTKEDDECTVRVRVRVSRAMTRKEEDEWMREFTSKLRRTRSVIIGVDTWAIVPAAGVGAASNSPSNDLMMSSAPVKAKTQKLVV